MRKALNAILVLAVLPAAGCISGQTSQNPTASFETATAAVRYHSNGSNIIFQDPSRSLTLDVENVRQISLGNLDGKLCLAAVGSDIRLYEVGADEINEIWRGLGSLNPWKVLIADADGDGLEEIAVGVYKKSRFHPIMAKRLFVYSWDGEGLQPKWLGSRLSRPFTDFAFMDGKLVAIEETRDQAMELAVYEWNGFGFSREWSGCKFARMSDLSEGDGVIRVRTGRSKRALTLEGYELKEAQR